MSETSTLTVSEFLKARWDEEATAANLANGRIWYVCDDGHIEEPVREELEHTFGFGDYERWEDGSYMLPNHHNSWHPLLDPDHVIADIAAKRAILALGICVACDVEMQPCDHRDEALRLLASVYRDHPDYRSEWSEAL